LNGGLIRRDRRLIGLSDPPGFAVESLAFTGRDENDFRRCRRGAKKRNCTVDSEGRTLWVVDAHRDNGKRFVVRSDEILSAFLELERITHELAVSALLGDDPR
jgi:hypothetical protein